MSTHTAHASSGASVPADGIKGLRDNWRTDLVAGLLVSLIALPLCLGIAMASGFPAFGGVVTAIIGGLIVGPLCGSALTIKGPAAGLIAIAIASVEALGQGNLSSGYRLTLAVIVVASVIQIVFALLKLGRFADFFPTSVVNGMLAAIGIIIFSKQVHRVLGVDAIASQPIPLLLEIPHSLVVMNPEIALVGVVSVLMVVFAVTLLGRLARFFPGPLLAVCAGVGLCLYFDFPHAHKYAWYAQEYSVDEHYLVTLPSSFFDGVTMPDFSKIFSSLSVQFILLFALIGSLEALLTNKAIDHLDPAHRKANMDRDLLAIGIGNLVCGFIGGLPMISEVVRSSANISYGARTRWANFFHGACLLAFVLALSPLIQLVPNAALAGVLCVTGYRLASPQRFREAKEVGNDQFLVFLTTVVATLLTDLLMGVVIGIVAEYLLCLAFGAPLKGLFASVKVGNKSKGGALILDMPQACYFGNVIGLKREVARFGNEPLILDFTKSSYVDHTFMHELRTLEREYSIQCSGLDRLKPLSSHHEAMRRVRAGGVGSVAA